MAGYSAGGTYRQGRTVYTGDSRSGSQCAAVIICFIVFLAIPLCCWIAEMEFRDRMLAFNEVEDPTLFVGIGLVLGN